MLQAQGPDCIGRRRIERKEKKRKKNLSCSFLILGGGCWWWCCCCRRSAIITVFGCFNNRPAPLITPMSLGSSIGGPVLLAVVIVVLTGRCGPHHPVSQKSMGANLSFIWLPARRRADGRTDGRRPTKLERRKGNE